MVLAYDGYNLSCAPLLERGGEDMKKIDYKKEFKHLYFPPAKEVVEVDVPRMNFIMLDGTGDPNTSQEFQEAMEALYGISFTAKFMIKKDGEAEADYVVPPLEGLWWAEDMAQFSVEKKDEWLWTVMIMQPEYVTRSIYKKACEQLKEKKDPPALSKVRFEGYKEGLSAQIMHIGPFSEEGPTVARVHDYIEEKGYEINGKHHEIYLSDFRRTKPERLKTVIRQPFRK